MCSIVVNIHLQEVIIYRGKVLVLTIDVRRVIRELSPHGSTTKSTSIIGMLNNFNKASVIVSSITFVLDLCFTNIATL